MKISQSNLQMASTHAASQRREVRETLRLWSGNRRPDFEGRGTDRAAPAETKPSGASGTAPGMEEDRNAVATDPKLGLIKAVLEFLTGRRIEIADLRELRAATAPAAIPDPARDRPAGYGIEYDRRESYSETERTTFSVQGAVRTADGREIGFTLDLVLERSYREESSSSLRLGDAARRQDPLVLNFAGPAARLSDTRFLFDLNADGAPELVHFAGAGSGFLAFDRNGDRKINDGSELFGPASGDGFAELARLDRDGNGWIDENDDVYQRLGIWIKDGDGKDCLQSLPEARVGAIALHRIATPFDIKGSTNEMQGQVRFSGVFLQEDGKAGTIQQIDLTV